MIAYFPTAYPDELLYSQLARYYTSTGYMAYRFAAEELFVSKTVRPDIEFVNAYTPTALKAITKDIPIAQIVNKHTMFPYYGRFLPKERRIKAFKALTDMTGNYHNLLPIPKNKSGKDRCLRYCPMCAVSDREIYGESYWHRVHQMMGINICPIHKCYLKDSSVIISGKATPSLKSAEEVIPMSEPYKISDNEIEIRVAEYMYKVFQSDVDMDSDVYVGDFLYSKMSDTKYRSIRGQQRNISLFHKEFTEFYNHLSNNWFTELWQIQKVLTNDRINFYEICLMAMFLDIPADELVSMKLPDKSQQQLFDEEIYRLHEQGLKYPEIAKRLNASYITVKAIGERRYGTYHKIPKQPLKSGAKPKYWKQIDEDTLPLVKEAIRQLQGDGTVRPKRVNVFTIEKMLKLPSKRLNNLPLCKAEIEKHKETQLEYWAREVVWAVRKVNKSGSTLTWRKIRDLTNMRHRDFEACLPYIHKFADNLLTEQLMNLL